MTEAYFENIHSIIKSNFGKPQRIVCIAVIRINFKEYSDAFEDVLSRGIKLEIVTNNIVSNTYPGNVLVVNHLRQLGVIIQIKNFERALMHHKFCVIDENLCITGSFNWTSNAKTILKT